MYSNSGNSAFPGSSDSFSSDSLGGSSGSSASSGGGRPAKLTVPQLRGRKGATAEGASKVVMVTAYDFTMAHLVDEAGVDMVLVGDSLGMVFQGLANTIPVTLDEICYHGRAVARGLARAHLVGDMPFMSYQVSPVQAVESAGKMMKEGAFESVKLEGGEDVAEHVHRIVRAGIPVVGHVGLTPQSVHALGGFKVQGRGSDEERIVKDARALDDAGVFAIVLEAIPPDVAARVTREVSVPTIGIGAGAACDGQVLVCTDLLGMSRGHAPKFAKHFAEVGDAIVNAVRAYASEVQAGTFPGAEHAYKPNSARPPEMPKEEPSAPRLRAVK
jgi:3-methyl-2-oxobutanoate hydroxymethyltransferase